MHSYKIHVGVEIVRSDAPTGGRCDINDCAACSYDWKKKAESIFKKAASIHLIGTLDANNADGSQSFTGGKLCSDGVTSARGQLRVTTGTTSVAKVKEIVPESCDYLMDFTVLSSALTMPNPPAVSYTHLTLPTTPYV